MGKKVASSNSFYREHDVVQRVDRKHWNKAIKLIDNAARRPALQNSMCHRTGHASRFNPRSSCSPSTSSFLLIEIRQALLRHDWSTVCQLYSCLLDAFQNHRVICNKIIMLILFSSPTSSQDIFKDFCRMVLGIDGDDIAVFLKTMSKLPCSIPRGFLQVIQDKLYVKTESGRVVADAYVKASMEERLDLSI